MASLLGPYPHVMGILNVTPDSFSDGGKYYQTDAAVHHALQMIEEGVDIIDIGGESSRPGAQEIPSAEEGRRVFPVIEQLRRHSDIPISIDTRKADVARGALERGANWVNDISAASFDDKMIDVVGTHRVTIVLMHMRGTPETMQDKTDYHDVVGQVCSYLLERAHVLEGQGILRDHIVLDPGLGFAKTHEQNIELLKNLSVFVETGYPIMVGTSRKSFIQKILGRDSSNVLEGSLAMAAWAILVGSAIVRVHDVNETVKLAQSLRAISS